MRVPAAALFWAIILLAPSLALTATIHVPADQPTIQAGIDAASESDTVLVADGTYTGDGNRDIDFGSKNIVVMSESGPDVTIIDCQGSEQEPHRGFHFHSGEDSTAVVDGFTIQGGYGLYDNPDGYSVGGGIKCDSSSSPKIINNTISGNGAYWGGGIFCYNNSNPTISNNAITGNSAQSGGGICCYDNSNPTINNNSISGNSVSGPWGGAGGGIFCRYSSPTISNNTITGNLANYDGGGIFCWSSSPIITNNTISGNWAEALGGGILCLDSDPTIGNNTITGNLANDEGGGILCWSSSPIITNNTISGNWAAFGGGIFCGVSNPTISNTIIAFSSQGEAIYCAADCNPILTYCNVFGNEGGDWIDCIAGQAGINGNFSADPLFCDPDNGDYHLDAFSPCAPGVQPTLELIGALSVGCGTVVCGDTDGNGELTEADLQRILDFYYDVSDDWPFPVSAGDMDCDGVITIADIVILAGYIHGYGATPCCAPPPKRPDLPQRGIDGGM